VGRLIRLGPVWVFVGPLHDYAVRGRQAWSPSELIDELRRWYDAGFSELVVSCSGGDRVRSADVAAEGVLPAMRGVR
jgi:hypothetical protein